MSRTLPVLLGATGCLAVAWSLACSGGSSSNTLPPPAATSGTVGFMATDATSETWSNVGIIIRKASLVLASDTKAANPVEIYNGAGDTTPINLLQLDQINSLLAATAGVPAGTYDRLIVEVDGSPSNITLVPAADPTTGIVPAAIDSSLIRVKGSPDPAQNTWMVLPTIKLSSPVTVPAGGASAVAVDFDLAHPAFIVTHDVTGADGTTTTFYVVNFNAGGAFRDKPAATLDKYYLRRHLGTVASVAAGGTAFTMTTEHGQTLTILADLTSPTLFYNLDVSPVVALPATTVPATLTAGLGVESTARYQADGSLTAVRVWYTATPANLPRWTPEGHIVKVNEGAGTFNVLDSTGQPQTIGVDAGTKWFFHGDLSTDISAGSGAAFLANIDRYFKVHVTANPLVTPVMASTVDIQRGVFEGSISAPTPSSFTYTRTWADGVLSTHNLGYDSAFSFWDFTFPGTADSTVADFVAEASDSVAMGATTFSPYAASSLDWVTGTGWEADNAVFMPIALSPKAQTVTTAYTASAGSFQVTATGATTPVTVTLDATAQEQPLVTTFTKQGVVVSVATVPASGWAAALGLAAKVRVYGVPDASGNIKAYYVNIYN